RVAVVEADHEPDRHQVAAALRRPHAVDPAAAERVRIERVAHRVHDESGRAPALADLPHLLHADRRDLRVLALQLPLGDQLLGQRTAAALGQHGELAREHAARLIAALVRAVLVDALVLQLHAGDAAAVAQQPAPGESGKDLYALLLGNGAE